MKLKKEIPSYALFLSRRDKSFSLIFGGIILSFYVLGLFMPSGTPIDSVEYMQMAKNIYTEGQFYCGDISLAVYPDDFTRRPPLYPLLAGPASFMGNAMWLLSLLQSIFLFIGVYLLRNVGFSMGYSQSYDKYLFLAFIFLPSLWIYPQLAMSESFLFFLLSVGVYWFIDGLNKKSEKRRALGIFIVGISALVKPVMLPMMLLLIIYGIGLTIRKRFRWSFISSVGLLLLLIIYIRFNYQRTGSMEFSSISTVNLVDYNTYYFNMERGGEAFAQAERAKIYGGLTEDMSYAEQLSARRKGGMEIIFSHPIGYGVFHVKGMVKFFLFPGRYDVFTFFGLDQSDFMIDKVAEGGYLRAMQYLIQTTPLWLLLLVGGSFLTKGILVIGFLSFLVHRRAPLFHRLILGGMIVYIALLTGPLGAARFFMPIGGLYLIASLIGLGSLWKRLR